jgi:hypothetical protein
MSARSTAGKINAEHVPGQRHRCWPPYETLHRLLSAAEAENPSKPSNTLLNTASKPSKPLSAREPNEPVNSLAARPLSRHHGHNDRCSYRMNPFARLIGLVLPAWRFPAAKEPPTPSLTDRAHAVRLGCSHTALVPPRWYASASQIVTSARQIPPDQLFTQVRNVIIYQRRTYQAAPIMEEF